MDYILFFFWLVYGGDVSQLSNPDYYTRSQAYNRLKSAGVWAVPALHVGRRTAKPEALHRIQILLDRRAAWWYPVILNIISKRDVTADQIRLAAQIAVTEPEAAVLLFREVDERKVFWSSNSAVWCQTMPYVNPSKTYAGEVEYMIVASRNQFHRANVSKVPPIGGETGE